MNNSTSAIAAINVSEENQMRERVWDPFKVVFPNGLIGCPEWRNFILQPYPADKLGELVCLDAQGISIAVANPVWLKVNYDFELDESDVAFLQLADVSEALVLCVLTLQRKPPVLYANLAGPLIINIKTKLGKQIVLNEQVYPLRTPVLDGQFAKEFIEILTRQPLEHETSQPNQNIPFMREKGA